MPDVTIPDVTPVPGASAVTQFADVALLGAYIGDDIEEDDLRGVAALEGATQLIRKYCDSEITIVEDDVVYLDGSGIDELVLPDREVTGVSEVILDYDLDDPTTLVASGEGTASEYTFTARGVLIRRGGVWPIRRKSIQVTYTHGFEEVPADIKIVTVAVASRAYTQDGANQESVGSYSASFAGQPGVLTADEKRMLGRYKTARRG